MINVTKIIAPAAIALAMFAVVPTANAAPASLGASIAEATNENVEQSAGDMTTKVGRRGGGRARGRGGRRFGGGGRRWGKWKHKKRFHFGYGHGYGYGYYAPRKRCFFSRYHGYVICKPRHYYY